MRREFYKLYAILECKEKHSRILKNYYYPISSKSSSISMLEEHPALVCNVSMKVITGCPEIGFNQCTQAYVNVIHKATKKIYVAQMYFDPVDEIKEALERKNIQEQVPVTVLTTGTKLSCPFANQFYGYANSNYYLSLLAKNKENQVYTYNNGNNVFHKKIAIIERDNKQALTIIGSYNWGGKSHKDYEMIVLIKSDQIAQKILESIRQDQQRSDLISYTQSLMHMHRISLAWIIGKIEHYLYPICIG